MLALADYNLGLRQRLHVQLLHLIALGIAAVGAFLLIAHWARGRPLWLDEEMIAINLRERTVGQLASPLWLGQSAPYGWLLLQRLVLLAFGNGERAVRLVPLAFGLGTLGTAVWIGRRWMRPTGAATLVLLCAMGEWISFHVHELKHYSADTCFGMLLPALAAWAAEPGGASADLRASRRRFIVFWSVAAVGQWLANGALLVAPAAAAALVIIVARKLGRRAAVEASALSLIWLASFALNDLVALRHARGSQYLQAFWAGAFPPPGASAVATVHWLAGQLTPLALKPGGSGYGLVFWATASAGLVFAMQRSAALGLAFAGVPVLAFALAAGRLVPLFERLSLWMIPALYVGIAFAADLSAELFRQPRRTEPWRVVAAAGTAGLLVVLCADIVRRGTTYLSLGPQTANHALDDRDAVRWLTGQRQPGDVWLTTHLALPAIWWYDAWNNQTDIFEASFVPDSRDCGSDDVRAVMRTGGRALVYLGFRFDDVPKGFDDLLLTRLGEIGQLTGYRPFGEAGHAIVIDLRERPPGSLAPLGPLTLTSVTGSPRGLPGARGSVPGLPGSAPEVPEGCIAARPARPW